LKNFTSTFVKFGIVSMIFQLCLVPLTKPRATLQVSDFFKPRTHSDKICSIIALDIVVVFGSSKAVTLSALRSWALAGLPQQKQ